MLTTPHRKNLRCSEIFHKTVNLDARHDAKTVRHEVLQELGWGGMDWTDLAQDMGTLQALMNAVMNFRVS